MASLPQHLSGSFERYTPAPILAAARRVFHGRINMDPASCSAAQANVAADFWYGEADNGLARPWGGNVWLNPPYGRNAQHQSNKELWAQKAAFELKSGRVRALIGLWTASISDRWFHELMIDGQVKALGFPRRIQFQGPGSTHHGQPGSSIFTYHGPDPDGFITEFSVFGPAGPVKGWKFSATGPGPYDEPKILAVL